LFHLQFPEMSPSATLQLKTNWVRFGVSFFWVSSLRYRALRQQQEGNRRDACSTACNLWINYAAARFWLAQPWDVKQTQRGGERWQARNPLMNCWMRTGGGARLISPILKWKSVSVEEECTAGRRKHFFKLNGLAADSIDKRNVKNVKQIKLQTATIGHLVSLLD